MEIQSGQQKRAERFGLVSLIVGIAGVPLWFLLLYLGAEAGHILTTVLFLALPPVAAVTGLAFGVFGLIQSVRSVPRSRKGIALAVIGIVLNLAVLAAAVLILWLYFHVHAVELAF